MKQYVLLLSIKHRLSQVKTETSNSYWFGRNMHSSAMILNVKIHLIFDWSISNCGFRNVSESGSAGLRGLLISSFFSIDDKPLHGILDSCFHKTVHKLAVIVLVPLSFQAIPLVWLNGSQNSMMLLMAASDSFQMMLSPLAFGRLGSLKTNSNYHLW